MRDVSRYVYAIVGASHPLPSEARGVGVPPSPVEALAVGELSAVIGPVPPDLRARRRDLLAHQALLMALAAGGPVLPMRFGTVAADEEALRARLADESAGYLAALARLDGRVEMNVKGLPVQDSTVALAAVVRADEQVRRLREEARRAPRYELSVRLGEAVAAGLARRAAEAADEARRRLGALAERVTEGHASAGHALNASFLLPAGDADRFRAAAEAFAAAARDRIALTVTGPLPCYSFVPGDGAPQRARTFADAPAGD